MNCEFYEFIIYHFPAYYNLGSMVKSVDS